MKQILPKDIYLNVVPKMAVQKASALPLFSPEEITVRLAKFKNRFENEGYDAAVVYADREHVSNFLYLTGIEPRFEEALLVITKETNTFILGNECENLAKLSPIDHSVIRCSMLSLPNQPMVSYEPLENTFVKLGLSGLKVGVIGWKLLPRDMYDIPTFIYSAISEVAAETANLTDILINPIDGLRLFNTATDIAVYEYGATVVSEGVERLFDNLKEGMSELEAGKYLMTQSMPIATHPMVVFGENCFKGLISPGNERLVKGCPMNVNIGLRGGLTCRGGYAAESAYDISDDARNFEEDIAKPYFAAVASWYASIGIGVNAGELYDFIEKIFPKKQYGWYLNAGHFTASEEWLSSASYHGSEAIYQSGQLIQADLIPSMDGYISPNIEDGIAIADDKLQQELKEKYPETYERMMTRRKYISEVLGIELRPEILPMSNLCCVYTPYFMNRSKAYVVGGRC